MPQYLHLPYYVVGKAMDSFVNLDQDRFQVVKILRQVHCSRVDSYILALLHVIENLGNLSPFAVGFMETSLSSFESKHLKKSLS